jgi:polysaccharide export outer membrane protein
MPISATHYTKKHIYGLFCMCLPVMLTACATPQNYRLFQTFDADNKSVNALTPISDADYQSELAFEWKIQKGDRLEIQFLSQPLSDYFPLSNAQILNREPRSLSRSGATNNVDRGGATNYAAEGVLVEPDGSVHLPIIGKITIGGLTESQATDVLNEAYKKYYRRAFVSVRILNQKIFVLGEVKFPQNNPIPVTNGTMSLIEALARAGDITDYADREHIKIIRNDLRNPTVRNIDLTRMENIALTSTILRPNDIVYVPPLDSKAYNVTFSERIPPFFSMIHSILMPFLDIRILNESKGASIRVLP